MARDSPRPDLDLPSGARLGEVIGRFNGAPGGGNGQTHPGTAAEKPQPSCIDRLARPEELQWLLGASINQNSQLAAQVRRLEAELHRSSAELARLRGELRGAVHDALTDPLTGLANRRSFDLELRAVGACAGSAPPAHLVMVDIDHFKRVNDAHGHDTGDRVLRIVGQLLLAKVRRDSLVARVGGDEFGLLLRGSTPHYTARIASRLCESLASRPLATRGSRGVIEGITLSIGLAARHAEERSTAWYARADAAMYEAKRGGGNRVSIARMLELEF